VRQRQQACLGVAYQAKTTEPDQACYVWNAIKTILSSLILSGCVAMKIVFDETGTDENVEVELIEITSCKCNCPLGVHHNEDTVAAKLMLILIELQGVPANDSFLIDAIFHGLNCHYDLLDGCMRLDGWLSHDGSTLSIVWNDFRCEGMSSDNDL